MKRKPWESDNSLNPKCEQCGNHQENAFMRIISGPCSKCHQQMKVAMIRANGTIEPDEFTPQQIEFAESNGVILQQHYSKLTEGTYLANTCNCGQRTEHSLFLNYWNPAEYGTENYELVIQNDTDFFYCLHCEEGRHNLSIG